MAWGDLERGAKIAAAANEMDPLVSKVAEGAKVPGLAIGIVAGGELVWFRGWGVRDVATRASVDVDSVFRIASMSKAFLSAAVLQLRDEGGLSLDEPVETYLPELRSISYPTTDSPRVTLRYLLSHASGLPEDNAVADLRLPMAESEFDRQLSAGLSFSTSPGTVFEYSNMGFMLATRVVSRVTGMRYQDYASRRLLQPLGMRGSTFDAREVPEEHRAHGYGRKGSAMPSQGLEKYQDDALHEEVVLEDGAGAGAGGLWTSPRDYARWVAFLLAAWPPRDGHETGPVRRASIREAQQAHTQFPLWGERDASGALEIYSGGYGFGWNVLTTCRWALRVSHSGGLPGYGSYVVLLPGEDVGIFAMTNLTYTDGYDLVWQLATGLQDRGLLPTRPRPVSPDLAQARDEVLGLLASYSPQRARSLFDADHWTYEPEQKLQARLELLRATHGTCRPASDAEPENALRGRMRLACDRGEIEMSLELTSDVPPRLQTLVLDSVLELSTQIVNAVTDAMRLLDKWNDTAAARLLAPKVDRDAARKGFAQVAANQGACKLGKPTRSDGTSSASFRLTCEKGAADLSITLDPVTGRATELSVSTVDRSMRCPR